MDTSAGQPLLTDLLQSLQPNLLCVYRSQVGPDWGERDSVPPYNKLYYICEGEGWIQIDGIDYYPKPGQLVLVPSCSAVSFSALNGRPYLKYWCHFTTTAGPLDLFQRINVPLCIDAGDGNGIISLFESLIGWNAEEGIVARLREKLGLLELLARYLEQAPIGILKLQDKEWTRLSGLRQYIEERLDRPISVNELADCVHLHPNYFIRYFKQHFGMPPLQYISRKRAEHAKRLLALSASSVKEVAAAVGFPDTSRFTRFFKKETGLTPTEYRSNASGPIRPSVSIVADGPSD
jgi:AraC-type DNA-binding domain-containing proteins